MNAETLLALAERVEKAEGPDREIDAAAHEAVGLPFEMEYWSEADTTPQRNLSKVPRYTASLDAAMTLVPEEFNWMAGNRNQPKARAYVENGELHFLGGMARNPALRWFEVVAATPALALTAAALRAIASRELAEKALFGEGRDG